MRFDKKTKYSFLAFLFSLGLMGCGDASIDPVAVGPSGPKYLLNGTLSNQTDENGFAYYINGTEAYVSRGTNEDAVPEVPSTVTLGGNTYDVTGVYHSGFSKADITGIVLPLSIETIDYQAFANSQLTSITIPCNVEQVGSGAFMNCHSLAAVQFKNDESTGSSTIDVCGGGGGGGGGGPAQGSSHLQTIPDYCFFNCESLTTVAFPRSLQTVESCAFTFCVGLTKIAFLEGFTTLKKLAFESCTSLEDIYLPSSFTKATNYPANCEQGAFYKVKKGCVIHLSTETEEIYNTWAAAKNWRYYKDDTSTLEVGDRLTQNVGLGSDYLYRVENGKATVFSYAPSAFPASGIVVMPNVIDGYDVAKAETTTYASYKTQITQIYLSHNLESIENGFFAGMTGLTTVSSTGDGCYTPTSDAIDLGAMTKLATVGTYLFTNATYMTGTFAGTVTLPLNLTLIEKGAFSGLQKATKIQFAEGTPKIARIKDEAFQYFGWSRGSQNYGDSPDSYFELTLPACCENIHNLAFGNMLGLRKIVFEGAAGKTLTLKPSCFSYCRSLCEIVLPRENTEIKIQEKAFYCCSSGNAKGFMNISGIEEVFLPSNVTEIGSLAFGANERACFFFENESRPAKFNDNFNQVFTESANGGDGSISTPSKKDFMFHGIRENAGVYFGVGIFAGNSTNKRRYIQTNELCFVETAAKNGKFICARYRYKPEDLAKDARVTVTVPEYIKFTQSDSDPVYTGEAGTNTDFEVISIGDSCFSASYSRGGKALAAVKVPHGIKRIGDNAFMRSIFFNKLTAYTGNNVSEDYTFPSSLKYIGRSAFAFCRLKKALSIPRDVLTFDMIAPAAVKAGDMPSDITGIDQATPRFYTGDEPRRYSSIFANDWLLNEVTFGEPTVANADQTMVYDSTIHGLYRLKEIASDNTMSDDVQLLMILPRLTNGFTDYKTDSEAGFVDKRSVDIGGTDHELRADTQSIRFGAWRMANWAEGVTLDSKIPGLFPKKWGTNDDSNELIPQALFIGAVSLQTYLNIGNPVNDVSYNIETTAFGIKGSTNGFIMPIGVLRNAKNVSSITIPGNLTEIPAFAFDQVINVSEWITPYNDDGDLRSGGEDGTSGVLDLRHTSIESIGASSFWGINSTTKIYLPQTLTNLAKDGEGRSAFEATTGNPVNTALLAVDMGDSDQLTTVPVRTFRGHNNLATVVLPPNITSVGESAFQDCPVADITWPTGAGFTTISKNAFVGSRIVNVVIPNSVMTIGDTAFKNNNASKILRLPAQLSDLKANSFEGNSSLNQVYFDMTQGGRNAKSYALTDKAFPSSVKYAMLPAFIKDNTNKPFSNSTNLKAVFYGGKAANKSGATTITGFKGGSDDAPIYYLAEGDGDYIKGTTNYWHPKTGSPWIAVAEIVSWNGDTPSVTSTTEYDFTTVLA